jgi:PAS domain S-box-containing protein
MARGGSSDRPGSEPSIEEVRARLREAEETLDAIRNGDVDAVVVGGPSGQQVYTLENADRPYRVLIEQMQEGALTLGRDGRILYCNERFAVLAGTVRQDLIGADIASFFQDGQLDVFAQMLSGAQTGAVSAELLMSSANGRLLPVNISLVDLTAQVGGERVVCGVVTDLSLIRRRSDELSAANLSLAGEVEHRRKVEGSLQLALDAAGMGSWDFDLVSGSAQRTLRHDQIFGYPTLVAHWTLDAALDHFLPEDRKLAEQAFDDSRRSGALDFEARIRRAGDGSIRWLRVTGQTFYDGEAPIRIAGVVTDVTDRRVVEERLRQSQKIDALGQLTGGVAHDFNNLLMVISSGLDLLPRQSDPERRQRILSGMRHAVQRGSGLSRQLLAFSRQQALRPEPVSLATRIGEMQELLDRSLRGDVQVLFEFAPGLWPVEVDPGEMEMVVLNLAVNARDAMPNGGQIVIRAENAPNLADEELQGDFVRLSVRDTGTGMSPEVMARVFEPFFTTKEIGKGSGLGLAQAHGFAKASGGAVRIESTVGIGTRVSIILPRTTKTVVEAAEDRASRQAGRPSLKASGQVLLVEDDNEVAALTGDLIEQLGYGVTRVASAEAALGALADGRPVDLVFSDVMMPGAMDGVALAREIRKRRPDLPMLLTSGFAEVVRKAAEAEGFQVLAKPYRLDDLAHAFEDARSANQP